MDEPSPNGLIGRDEKGRFATGNPGGPGNPHAKRVARLRSSLLDAVSPDDLGDVIRALVTSAKAGDTAAARLLLEYSVGKPKPQEEAHEPPATFVFDFGAAELPRRELVSVARAEGC